MDLHGKRIFFKVFLLYKQGLVKHNTVVTHGIEDENMNDLEHERMGELLYYGVAGTISLMKYIHFSIFDNLSKGHP